MDQEHVDGKIRDRTRSDYTHHLRKEGNRRPRARQETNCFDKIHSTLLYRNILFSLTLKPTISDNFAKHEESMFGWKCHEKRRVVYRPMEIGSSNSVACRHAVVPSVP